MTFRNDGYILFSAAAVMIAVLICAVGSFNTEGTDGNGIVEITGVITEQAATQNGTVFKVTDLGGNEIKCFSSLPIPEASTLCRLVGTFSDDGNIFFVDTITPGNGR